MKKIYKELLEDYEDKLALVNELAPLGQGRSGQGEGDGEEEPDEQGADAGHLSSYVIQERSSGRLAALQNSIHRQMSRGKLIQFYDELGQLLRTGQDVIESASRDSYYTTAFVGRNNLGKSTVVQALVHLGTVSQDQYEDFARPDDEPLEAQWLVGEWEEKQRERRLRQQQQQAGAAAAQGGDDDDGDVDGDGPQHIDPEPNDYFFTAEGSMRNDRARGEEEAGMRKYLKVCEMIRWASCFVVRFLPWWDDHNGRIE